MTEDELKQQIRQKLSDDFRVVEEIRGFHLIEQWPVRIDFLCYPLPHLSANGFDPFVFGVEAKQIGGYGAGKVYRLLWQAITYSQSTFPINGKKHRPGFVLMCVDGEPDNPDLWRYLLQFAQYANVGLLDFPKYHGWRIRFGGGSYYSQKNGKGKVENIGTIRYVGSIS